MHCFNVVGRIGLAALLLFSANTQSIAQSAFPTQEEQAQAIGDMRPDTPRDCKTSTIITYDVRRYWLPASIQVCPGGEIRDVTEGPFAMAHGEMLFEIHGRASLGSPYSFTRAYPNIAYEFARPEYGFVDYMPHADQPGTFGAMVVTLPFVPNSLYQYQQRIYQHASDEVTKYAYGDLRFIPGLEKLAYPLNRNSVVLRVDGFYFAAPTSLMAMMQYDNRDISPYVEVEYIQRDEKTETLRSVFLPVLTVKAAGPGWTSLTASSPFSKIETNSDSSHVLAKLAGLGAVIGLAYLWESAMGNLWRTQQAECRQSFHAPGAVIYC